LTEEQINVIQNVGNCIAPAEIGRILFENFDNLEGALNSLNEYSNNYIDKLKKQEEILSEKQTAVENKSNLSQDEFTNNVVIHDEMEQETELQSFGGFNGSGGGFAMI
jgi:hypothetical protein